MSIVSEEMNLSCDFHPKVTNTADLKYSSQHWNLMKQKSNNK